LEKQQRPTAVPAYLSDKLAPLLSWQVRAAHSLHSFLPSATTFMHSTYPYKETSRYKKPNQKPAPPSVFYIAVSAFRAYRRPLTAPLLISQAARAFWITC